MWFGAGPFYHGFFGIGGMFMMFLFFLIAVGAIFFIVRWFLGNNGCGMRHFSENSDDALEILKKRFAKGEISKDEFEDAKKHLL